MKKYTRPFTHIGEVVKDLLGTSALPINLSDARIWRVWDGVVGEKIAGHARPSTINKGVLLVKVTDSVWLQELEFMAEEIRARLNEKLKREAVRKIQFRVGAPQQSAEPDTEKSTRDIDHDLSPGTEKEMNQILARVKDKELRSSIRQFLKQAAKKDIVL